MRPGLVVVLAKGGGRGSGGVAALPWAWHRGKDDDAVTRAHSGVWRSVTG